MKGLDLDMPLTVITITNAPNSLRGDLTKWMQEISVGVYVGNFNTRVREKLWTRVTESIGKGQATMSYASRNEIGYAFEMHQAHRKSIDYEGIPLVFIPTINSTDQSDLTKGFSKAAKFRKVEQIAKAKAKVAVIYKDYVVLDIETDGLNNKAHQILEVGAVKIVQGKASNFSEMIEYHKQLPEEISKLTGITQELLNDQGKPLDTVLGQLKEFINDLPIVGYSINFDIGFINYALRSLREPLIKNKTFDLLRYVKDDKKFLKSYRLQEVLSEYGIEDNVAHRGLDDAKMIYELSTKVNGFLELLPGD